MSFLPVPTASRLSYPQQMAMLPAATQGSRTYAPDGTMNTQVTAPGGVDPNLLAALEDRRRHARLMQRAQLAAMRNAERPRSTGSNTHTERAGVAQQNEAPWYSQQAVAMTPVHGFNMGGGYTIDPNKLPPWMRPKQAEIGAPMPESRAGLSSSPSANMPAAGGFTAGQEYKGEGGEGGGPVAAGGGDERPDWLGTGTTNTALQQRILIRNAQQRAMEEAMMYGQYGPRSNSGRINLGGSGIGQPVY